jgi:hypothetical protein
MTTLRSGAQCSDDILLESLSHYYNRHPNLSMILDIIQHRSPISLRLVDHFTTKYAPMLNINYSIQIGTEPDGSARTQHIWVHANYKSQLMAFSKKKFDPFCRRSRIQFHVNGLSQPIKTTIGQLNFFRWAYNKRVIHYINDHLAEIEEDMNRCTRENASRSSRESAHESVPADEDGSVASSASASVASGNLTATSGENANSGRKRRRTANSGSRRGMSCHNVPILVSFT